MVVAQLHSQPASTSGRMHSKMLLPQQPVATPLFGRSTLPQPFRRICHPAEQLHRLQTVSAAAAESGLEGGDQGGAAPPSTDLQVFPRRKERDPYRRLGVPQDASFEEIESAKAFLMDQYKWHNDSRESIELAYDAVLQECYKRRNKFGFKPPKTGRRTDVQGEAEKQTLWEQVLDYVDPAVSKATVVNDGFIFLGLAVWTAYQAAIDPTLPLCGAIALCAYKIFDKRKKRNPDGPFVGGSPIWGALFATLATIVTTGVLGYLLTTYIPLPRTWDLHILKLFLVNIGLGVTAIFLR